MAKRALILLSGGLDSTTVLAMALKAGYEVSALSFDYNQKHKQELTLARRVAREYKVKHQVIKLPKEPFASSPLTGVGAVPKNRLTSGIAPTYVAGRNLAFLAIAASYAETHKISTIALGVNSVDYSGYPDCRKEFLDAFKKCLNLGTAAANFVIYAPLLTLTKSQIIKKGIKLGVDYGKTASCYEPLVSIFGKAKPCGACEACLMRARGFHQAGLKDPLLA